MFAILYETGTSGFYLGYDTTFEDAENRFSRIAGKNGQNDHHISV